MHESRKKILRALLSERARLLEKMGCCEEQNGLDNGKDGAETIFSYVSFSLPLALACATKNKERNSKYSRQSVKFFGIFFRLPKKNKKKREKI